MASRHRPDVSAAMQDAQRPDSRASTTSATSQQNDILPHPHQDAPIAYDVAGNSEPEAALLQYHASMGQQVVPQYDVPNQQHNSHPHPHSHPRPQSATFPPQGAYAGQDQAFWGPDSAHSQPARVGSVPLRPGSDLQDDRRRRGSAVTATNDKELREMLVKNEGRPLRDVAQEVIQKERTPMAEKTKQLFAMLWLRAVCKPAKTSVPRNRVYLQYANRCGTERVVPLNPASFGKLVRVIFPGIQTRRLGVRGESKYHYVDLALDEEQPNVPVSWHPPGSQQLDQRQRPQSSNVQQLDFNNVPRLQTDTASFPTTDGSFDIHSTATPSLRGPPSRSQVFAYPDTRGMQSGTAETLTYSHTLRFPSGGAPVFSENEPVTLPSIQPYLPPRTDSDTAEALFALYRTHCTSLIDSIRFCKEKQFFRLYTSFHGTLTVPVQKLFTHPNLAPWIEQCDLIMYRTMIRFVSRLTLQAAPVVVINILSNISSNLHGHIAKTFATQPPHVHQAKLRPATVFASLLHRLIRVNQSAHAAANLLTIDQNREQMWREWITMVNPKRVMEAELPDCGYEGVYKILTSEMRVLLEPLQAPAYNDDPYGFGAYNFEENGSFAQFLQSQSMQPASRGGASAVSTENVLDRWSTFITSLPGRFPNAPTRTLLHCISAVGTAALRDITIMNGLSYGHWWVLKIFVDEMSLWQAEMGGFLESNPADSVLDSNNPFQSPVLDNSNSRSHSQSGSRMSSMGADSTTQNNARSNNNEPMFMSNPQQQQSQQHPASQGYSNPHPNANPHHLSFPAQQQHSNPQANKHQQQQQQQQQQQHETDLDDSGIGMSLLEDDLSLAKFGISASAPHHGPNGIVGA